MDQTALHRYGQAFVQETPELKHSKLQELSELLSSDTFSTPEKKKHYITASTYSHECNDWSKLKFLRCECFRVEDAAKRIINYWNKRVELFGEKAFQPMTQSMACSDDAHALRINYVMPVVDSRTGDIIKDDAGRGILYIEPYRLTDQVYDRTSMTRATWYSIHALLEDEEIQKKGIIVVFYPRNFSKYSSDRILSKNNITSMRSYLPVKLEAIHCCHPPYFFEFFYALLSTLLGERLRKRVIIHSESDEEVLQTLEQTYGIVRGKIPDFMQGGGLTLDYRGWLELRKNQGK
ncbi:hypothetical protein CTEN210_06379 [Chaetoceros tenuissimus]|uniref:CRAL-TRIO domain-containing protein n=1 Tax=Chaetoceros tenuissimus TaxID=426638 RepID=A0AAD3CQ98_9STRA|nr:hypothetical protein CTEN210_06379 [Chaetoceros tenuissimus]